MKVPTVLAALALLAAAPAALADTLKVPSEYATIQSAVNAAQSGDRIVIAAGNYSEDVVVGDKTDLEIRGSGWPVFLGPEASLSVNTGSTGILVRGLEFADANLTVSSSSNVVLTKLRIHDNGTGITTGGCDDVVISKCEFRDVAGDAIVDTDSDGFRVEKCGFTGVVGYAVALTPDNSVGTMNAVIAKNRIVNAGGGAWLGGLGTVVEKNRMEGLVGPGVQTNGFVNTSGAEISKNRISSTTDYGIFLTYLSHFVEKNTLYGTGIYVSGTGHLVDGNRVYNSPIIGIRVVNPATLTRNTVRNPGNEGFLIQGDGSVLDRNAVVDGNSSGFVVLGDDCTIDRCSSLRADFNGFFIMGTGNTLTRNKARGSGELDLADTNAEGVNDYDRNHFGTEQFNYVL